MKSLLPGTLCKIKIEGLNYTPDGFMCAHHDGPLSSRLFQNIDIFTYPSSRDFFGKNIIVRENDIALVVKYSGRPISIKKDPEWFCYDVYQILVKGFLGEIFYQNLSVLKSIHLEI